MGSGFKRSIFEREEGRPLLRGWPGRLYRFFSVDLWRRDREPLNLLRRLLRRAGRLSFLTFSGFVGDRCVVRASALTFVTVLSLVPLLALSFAALKGLGFYQELRQKVIDPGLDRFLPVAVVDPGGIDPGGGPIAPVVESPALRESVERVLDLVEQTDFKAMTAIGLLVVLWAVLRLLGTIEAAFNDIWGVRRSRSFVRKLTDYLAIVVIAPIFLVVAVGFTSAAQTAGFGAFVDERLGLGALIDLSVRLMPLLAGWMAFTFVYVALPNTRTNLSSAALGGLVAGTLWQIALAAHLKFQIGVANYSKIYSTFAAIPVFMVWVQVSWVIVLFGAELAFAHQHERDYRRVVGWRDASPAMRARVALRALARVVAAFLDGREPRAADELAGELGVPAHPVEEVLRALEATGTVAPAGDPVEGRWLLARDPAGVRVADVLEALEGRVAPGQLSEDSGADRLTDRLLAALAEERQGSAYNLTLRELAERGAEREERPDEAAGLGAVRPEPS